MRWCEEITGFNSNSGVQLVSTAALVMNKNTSLYIYTHCPRHYTCPVTYWCAIPNMFLKPPRGYKRNMYWPFCTLRGVFWNECWQVGWCFISSLPSKAVGICPSALYSAVIGSSSTVTWRQQQQKKNPFKLLHSCLRGNLTIYIPRKLWLQPVAGSQLQPVAASWCNCLFSLTFRKRWNTVVWSALDWRICQAFKQHFCHLSD